MHKLIKTIFKNQVYFFLFISIWLCIDTNFEDILQLKNEINVRNFFLFIRASLPLFLIATLLFIVAINKNYQLIFSTNNKSLNIILFSFSIFFLIQMYGLFVTKNNIINFYYAIVALITIVCTLYSYNQKLEKISYFTCLFFIGLVITVYSYLNYKWLFTTHSLQLYGTFPHVYWSLEAFSNHAIRSSGLSRSSLLLLLPVFFVLLIDRIKFIYLSIYLILTANIYLTQSRTVLIFYIPFVCFAVFYFLRKENAIHIFKKFIILFVLPIIFFNSVLIIKEEFRTKFFIKKTFEKLNLDKKIEIEDIVTSQKQKYKEAGCEEYLARQGFEYSLYVDYRYNRGFKLKCHMLSGATDFMEDTVVRALDPTTITSNRFTYWSDIISLSERPITGYGTLGDRFLINENAHNNLMYSYASGGIISVALMLILIIRYTYVCIFLTFFKKIPLIKENIILFSSIFTISFLVYRGITQVSIAVFSIDLIVFLSCVTICERYLKRTKH